eukprot:7598660-Ditylum_brightwellii.AAC.1
MAKTERGNTKTSPSCITRDVTVWEIAIKEKEDFFCNYHGLWYHGMDKCNFVQSHRKQIQPMYRITEQQRLWQVQFVKDAKRQAKKRSLIGKEVKDLNVFVKDKIKEMIKEHNRNMH